MAERIHKVLANAGIGSRRQIERWIEQGRIVVDGRPAQLGDRLTGLENIHLDGQRLSVGRDARHREQFLCYYKPAGEICTRDDPEGRPTVFDRIKPPKRGRWVSVGRLDINTSGLLLLTTDGELAHRLMHPSYGIEREYAARVLGELTVNQRKALLSGIELEDGVARFGRIKRSGGSGSNVWYRVTLAEGRYREVRRAFEALEMAVSRLIRVRFGPIELNELRRAESRGLNAAEIDALYEAVGLDRPEAR